MKTLFTLSLFLLVAISGAMGQVVNLVPNGGFEAIFNPPAGEGDIYEAVGWSNLNGGTVYPNATPDFFHTSGTNGVQIPNTYAGDITALEGNGVAGFITYNFFVPNFREYIGIPLNQTTTPGTTYNVSFWLSNSQGNSYGSQGTNSIGAAFTIGAPTQNVNQPLSLMPQIEIPTVTYHNGWVNYSFTFVATDSYDHMTIGNFRDDLNTQRSTFNSGFNLANYFIDMISVTDGSPLSIERLSLNRTSMSDGIEMEWRLPDNNVSGDWYLERSTDQVAFKTLEIIKDENGDLAGQSGTHYDESAFANVNYFYRMRHVNSEGEVEYSDMVMARFEGEKTYTAGPVFPNPVVDRFSLEFASAEGGEMQIEIVDQMGKSIYSEVRNIDAGEQVIGFEFAEELAQGFYYATFIFDGDRITRKIVAASSL